MAVEARIRKGRVGGVARVACRIIYSRSTGSPSTKYNEGIVQVKSQVVLGLTQGPGSGRKRELHLSLKDIDFDRRPKLLETGAVTNEAGRFFSVIYLFIAPRI